MSGLREIALRGWFERLGKRVRKEGAVTVTLDPKGKITKLDVVSFAASNGFASMLCEDGCIRVAKRQHAEPETVGA